MNVQQKQVLGQILPNVQICTSKQVQRLKHLSVQELGELGLVTPEYSLWLWVLFPGEVGTEMQSLGDLSVNH